LRFDGEILQRVISKYPRRANHRQRRRGYDRRGSGV